MTDRPETAAGVDGVDLSGRTALVTGPTSGVGRETALALARLGADAPIHGRDRAAGERVARAAGAVGSDVAVYAADFADPDAGDALARAVGADRGAVDLLVHDAGARFREGSLVDASGARVERTFAVRSVVTAGAGEGYDGLVAYARSKLANGTFARGLADGLDGPTATACHPGFVPDGGLWRNASLPVSLGVGALSRLPRRLVPFVDTAAVTQTYLAAASDAAGLVGEYVVDRAPTEPSPAARRPGAVDDPWAPSERPTGLPW